MISIILQNDIDDESNIIFSIDTASRFLSFLSESFMLPTHQ
jgi:hypothetical protein